MDLIYQFTRFGLENYANLYMNTDTIINIPIDVIMNLLMIQLRVKYMLETVT